MFAADNTSLDKLLRDTDELYGQGRFNDAAAAGEGALKLAEKTFGTGDTHVVDFLNSLATVYKSQQRYDDARALYARSLAILDKDPNEHSLIMVTILENYADLLKKMGNADEAVQYRARAKAVLASAASPPPRKPDRVRETTTSVDVEDVKDALMQEIDQRVAQLVKQGYAIAQRYYDLSWSAVTPGKVYEGVFTKRVPSMTGEPVLYGLKRTSARAIEFATISLDFGKEQPRVKAALASLAVGDSTTIRLSFPR